MRAAPHPSFTANPVALVTGGARRLGRSIAEALAEQGWQVAIHYRESAQAATALVQTLEASGHRAVACPLALDETLTAQAADQYLADIQHRLGPITLVVNNASHFEFDLADSASTASLRSHHETNLIAPVLLTQALYRQCQSNNRKGVVINLLDQKLDNPNPDFFSYTLSKAGLLWATRLMAQTLAPTLRVLAVSPGITLPSADQSEAEFRQTHAQTPLGASSTPDDIAQAILWLAQSPAITGTHLLVDGGQHLLPSARDVMFSTR
jgi:NAD(P)-dependent dehydrogenase (short-subunit alcohol dehydrogenase family)